MMLPFYWIANRWRVPCFIIIEKGLRLMTNTARKEKKSGIYSTGTGVDMAIAE
jgi:hypothetical protein